MTKSELIERLADKLNHLSAKEVEQAIKEILEMMAQTLAKGERIEIRGFGSFSLHYRAPRTGRNPKTGEEVQNNVFYFTFKFNKDYQFEEILASSDPGWDVSEACFNHEEIRQKWGLDLFIDEDHHEEYRSTFIRSKTYNLKLVCIRIKPFLGTLLSQKEIFDLCIPLILNTSLFFAWVIKASFT